MAAARFRMTPRHLAKINRLFPPSCFAAVLLQTATETDAMRLMQSLFLAGLVIASGAGQATAQETIKAYTADLPPWTNEGNTAKPGFAYEVMREMAKRSGLEIDIEMTAWRRGQEEM